MRRSHIIFNVIGLVIAAVLVFSALSGLFIVIPEIPPEKRGFWHFLIVLESIMIVLLGGGGIANFAKGKLSGWPTGAMIFAYCVSLWLLPLGIWGITALLMEHRRRRDRIEPPTQTPSV